MIEKAGMIRFVPKTSSLNRPRYRPKLKEPMLSGGIHLRHHWTDRYHWHIPNYMAGLLETMKNKHETIS